VRWVKGREGVLLVVVEKMWLQLVRAEISPREGV
jgi:hypothetical protein